MTSNISFGLNRTLQPVTVQSPTTTGAPQISITPAQHGHQSSDVFFRGKPNGRPKKYNTADEQRESVRLAQQKFRLGREGYIKALETAYSLRFQEDPKVVLKPKPENKRLKAGEGLDSEEKRKLKNRIAQAQFRRRRDDYIQKLETSLGITKETHEANEAHQNEDHSLLQLAQENMPELWQPILEQDNLASPHDWASNEELIFNNMFPGPETDMVHPNAWVNLEAQHQNPFAYEAMETQWGHSVDPTLFATSEPLWLFQDPVSQAEPFYGEPIENPMEWNQPPVKTPSPFSFKNMLGSNSSFTPEAETIAPHQDKPVDEGFQIPMLTWTDFQNLLSGNILRGNPHQQHPADSSHAKKGLFHRS